MLLLLFVVAAAVTVRGRKSPHSIYNNSRSTAPAAVMLIIIDVDPRIHGAAARAAARAAAGAAAGAAAVCTYYVVMGSTFCAPYMTKCT